LFQLTLALARTVAPRVSLATSRTVRRSVCKGAWALRTRSNPSCTLCARASVPMQDRLGNRKSSPRLVIKEVAPQRKPLLCSPPFYRIKKSQERADGKLESSSEIPQIPLRSKFESKLLKTPHAGCDVAGLESNSRFGY
jgi:hypothetical protein